MFLLNKMFQSKRILKTDSQFSAPNNIEKTHFNQKEGGALCSSGLHTGALEGWKPVLF